MASPAKKWKIIVAAMTLVITLETGWIGISQLIAPNQIEPSEAQRFFVQFYYPTALQDPAKALNHLSTAQFRAQKEATGIENYISFYRHTKAIEHVSAVRHNDEPYLFDISLDRTYGQITRKKVIVVFGLECVNGWQAHIPWAHCPAENLRINYSAGARSV